MDYVTLLQLAESPGALELAQVASDSHGAVVDAELMELTLRGEDRSAYDAADIAAADAAKTRIEELVAEASAVIDGYLGRRYSLPLDSTPAVVTAWARSIVRYKLNKDRATDERTDPVVRDYRDALKFLQQIAEGRFSLGLEDPQASSATATEVHFEAGAKVFGREFLP
jgi:phage gp36-like protein